MSDFTVRPAARADIPSILELSQALWREHGRIDPTFAVNPVAREVHRVWLKRSLKHRDCRLLVAEAGGKMVGTATATITTAPLFWPPKYGYLRDLYVVPDQRRHGLGSLLVRELLDWLGSQQVQRVELVALAANQESRAFWAAQSFEAKFLIYHLAL